MAQELNFTPETLRGEIKSVVFESSDGGYSVIRVLDPEGKVFTVVGPIPNPEPGQNIEVVGRWEKHDSYGRQLRCSSYKFILPSTREGLIRYLGSGMIHGVGKTLAGRIVDYFGAKTLDVLSNAPRRLAEVPKIGRKKAAAIARSWAESSALRETFIFFQGLGISSAYCNRLIKRYGDGAADAVRSNPYRLAEEVDGVGFIRADEIARNLGIGEDSLDRMTAAAVYALNTAVLDGHVGYPEGKLVDKCLELTKQPTEHVRAGIDNAVLRSLLVKRDNLVYSPQLAAAELELPREVSRLLNTDRFAGQRLKYASGDPALKLADEQLAAIDRVMESPLSIITGGPGVGKTTVVGEIVRRARQAKLNIALAAPTGRAAKRLSEATGMEAKTIHRLLQFDPISGTFVHGRGNPLNFDLLIVDEVSMLDILLSLALFRSIRTSCSLVLVGDADQLPSVGPGTVLADFINCGRFAVTHLVRIFRQGRNSMIVENAHKVNRGIMPEPPPPEAGKLSDFYFIAQNDDAKVLELLQKLVLERIVNRFKLNPVDDVQILTPMNRGSCGTQNLNALFQSLLNPAAPAEFRIGERLYKTGDKVMQNANNYDKNVFNGDIGRIYSIDKRRRTFVVSFDDRRSAEYSFDESNQLSLAYAVTVHKAQGCEFPAVVMLMMPQHYMLLQRNLLYTAMTRAKKLLILLGSPRSIHSAVANRDVEVRYSMLGKYLKEI